MLNIPHCGQQLKFTKDYVLEVPFHYYNQGNLDMLIATGHIEHRNSEYFHTATDSVVTREERFVDLEDSKTFPVLIPKGTILEIGQMYVRKNGWYNDSISLKVIASDSEALMKVKRASAFRLTLDQANGMPVTFVSKEETVKRVK